MLEAVVRLVAITLGVVILTVLAVVLVRWIGAHQEFQQPPHVWFEKPQWNVTAPTLEELCAKPPAAQDGRIVMVPIHRSREQGWQVPCPAGAVALDQFIERATNTDWILKIDEKDTPDLEKLVDGLSRFDRDRRFAVYAPAQKVARVLRKQAPQWLFAADTASLLRLHLFSSLYLAPAIDFWPDFVIASPDSKDGSRLSENEAKELRRRNKRILWNSLVDPQAQPAYDVDGRITPN